MMMSRPHLVASILLLSILAACGKEAKVRSLCSAWTEGELASVVPTGEPELDRAIEAVLSEGANARHEGFQTLAEHARALDEADQVDACKALLDEAARWRRRWDDIAVPPDMAPPACPGCGPIKTGVDVWLERDDEGYSLKVAGHGVAKLDAEGFIPQAWLSGPPDYQAPVLSSMAGRIGKQLQRDTSDPPKPIVILAPKTLPAATLVRLVESAFVAEPRTIEAKRGSAEHTKAPPSKVFLVLDGIEGRLTAQEVCRPKAVSGAAPEGSFDALFSKAWTDAEQRISEGEPFPCLALVSGG